MRVIVRELLSHSDNDPEHERSLADALTAVLAGVYYPP